MRKGFTLIELLIVIGVLGILATAVVLVLNPAEILKQIRDGQRISDLRALRNAIELYLVRNTSSPTSLNEAVCISGNATYPQWRASIVFGTLPAMSSNQQPFVNSGVIQIPTELPEAPAQVANPRFVNGGGWVPVDFTAIQGNSPFSKLPLDPRNIAPAGSQLTTPNEYPPGTPVVTDPAAYFYAYQCQGLTYEINANMESVKYSYLGDRDVESKDGGTVARISAVGFSVTDPVPGVPTTFVADQIYEVGNDPGLDL